MSIVLVGSTSGSITLQEPAVAGTTVLDLPATSGTILTTASTGINASNITTGTLAVANGGTGVNTLTANNVILGNGTSAPSFVAPGTNGNVLTSNGTTWTSAAASGSPLVFLSTTLVTSAVTAVTFTGLDNSTYISFMLEYENLISDVGGQAVCLQLGTNSGLQSNYSGSVITNNNSSTSLAFSNSTSDSFLRITTSDTRADSLGGVNGIAWISNINSTSAPAVRAHSNYFNSNNGNSYNSLASGNAPTSYSVTQVSIRFVPATTINISSGRVTIYGLKAS